MTGARNENNELRLGATIIFKSKRGTEYFIHNAGGDYEVWVEKLIRSKGGYKRVCELREATNEIKQAVTLEQE